MGALLVENAAELLIESALRFSQNDSISRDQLSQGFDSIIKNFVSFPKTQSRVKRSNKMPCSALILTNPSLTCIGSAIGL
jgi:hypothetical protein